MRARRIENFDDLIKDEILYNIDYIWDRDFYIIYPIVIRKKYRYSWDRDMIVYLIIRV